jgi:hypothetical protein
MLDNFDELNKNCKVTDFFNPHLVYLLYWFIKKNSKVKIEGEREIRDKKKWSGEKKSEKWPEKNK